MGLRINPYLIFKTLSSKRSSSRVENEVFDYFEKFNAIAFVIHDPLLHIEFDSYLQNKFEELDEVTGEKLLFFIFNQGSADTKSPFSKLKTNLDLYEGQEVTDDVFSSQSFAQELGIDNSELPCILISNDYNARKFVYKPIIQKEEVFILQKLANYLNASIHLIIMF
ncbi:MAG: hypothetical protein IPI23_14190 [Bacteroidetes bacterium]|nr:hypothetical protein [Bacteroidota bacterium]